MKKRSTISRWSGWLASIAAAGLIVLAVLVGIARLLLPMAPEYQDDIRRFANEATGFDVQFAQLSASWPLHGPEIRFLDVHVRTRDGRQPVLDAAELSVGINLLQLVTERRLLPGRVAVRQADVRIERLPDGKVLVNAVPLEDLLRQPRSRELPHLDLDLRDIGVLLHDAGRLVPDASLMTKKLDLRLAPDSIGFDGELEGRDELGRGFEFAGTLPAAMLPGAERDEGSPAPEWSFSLAATDVEVGRALRLLTNQWVPLKSGRGQLEIELAKLKSDHQARESEQTALRLRPDQIRDRRLAARPEQPLIDVDHFLQFPPAVFVNKLSPLRALLHAQLLLQDVIYRLRVGLAARRLHNLADEPADH